MPNGTQLETQQPSTQQSGPPPTPPTPGPDQPRYQAYFKLRSVLQEQYANKLKGLFRKDFLGSLERKLAQKRDELSHFPDDQDLKEDLLNLENQTQHFADQASNTGFIVAQKTIKLLPSQAVINKQHILEALNKAQESLVDSDFFYFFILPNKAKRGQLAIQVANTIDTNSLFGQTLLRQAKQESQAYAESQDPNTAPTQEEIFDDIQQQAKNLGFTEKQSQKISQESTDILETKALNYETEIPQKQKITIFQHVIEKFGGKIGKEKGEELAKSLSQATQKKTDKHLSSLGLNKIKIFREKGLIKRLFNVSKTKGHFKRVGKILRISRAIRHPIRAVVGKITGAVKKVLKKAAKFALKTTAKILIKVGLGGVVKKVEQAVLALSGVGIPVLIAQEIVLAGIGKGVGTLFGLVKDWLKSIKKVVTDPVKGATEIFKTGVDTAGAVVGGTVGGITGAVGGTIGGALVGFLFGGIGAIPGALLGLVSGTIGGASLGADFGYKLRRKLKKYLIIAGVGVGLFEILKNLPKLFWDLFKKTLHSGLDFATGIVQKGLGSLHNGWDTVLNFVDDKLGFIPGVKNVTHSIRLLSDFSFSRVDTFLNLVNSTGHRTINVFTNLTESTAKFITSPGKESAFNLVHAAHEVPKLGVDIVTGIPRFGFETMHGSNQVYLQIIEDNLGFFPGISKGVEVANTVNDVVYGVLDKPWEVAQETGHGLVELNEVMITQHAPQAAAIAQEQGIIEGIKYYARNFGSEAFKFGKNVSDIFFSPFKTPTPAIPAPAAEAAAEGAGGAGTGLRPLSEGFIKGSETIAKQTLSKGAQTFSRITGIARHQTTQVAYQTESVLHAITTVSVPNWLAASPLMALGLIGAFALITYTVLLTAFYVHPTQVDPYAYNVDRGVPGSRFIQVQKTAQATVNGTNFGPSSQLTLPNPNNPFTISYTIRVTAVDNDLSNIEITDGYSASGANNPPTPGSQTWNLDSLTDGNTWTQTVSLNIPIIGSDLVQWRDALLLNTVTVSASVNSRIEQSQTTATITIGSPPSCPPSLSPIQSSYYVSGYRYTNNGISCASFGASHPGIDLNTTSLNKTLVSSFACNAQVVFAGADPGCGSVCYLGWYVVLKSGSWYAFYAHMQPNLLVNAGDTVGPGESIGFINASGNSKGAHLHYEIRQDPGVNPASSCQAPLAVNPCNFGIAC